MEIVRDPPRGTRGGDVWLAFVGLKEEKSRVGWFSLLEGKRKRRRKRKRKAGSSKRGVEQ